LTFNTKIRKIYIKIGKGEGIMPIIAKANSVIGSTLLVVFGLKEL